MRAADVDGALALHVVQQLLRDRRRAGLRPIADYLAAYPDHGELVRSLYAAVAAATATGDVAPDPEPRRG